MCKPGTPESAVPNFVLNEEMFSAAFTGDLETAPQLGILAPGVEDVQIYLEDVGRMKELLRLADGIFMPWVYPIILDKQLNILNVGVPTKTGPSLFEAAFQEWGYQAIFRGSLTYQDLRLGCNRRDFQAVQEYPAIMSPNPADGLVKVNFTHQGAGGGQVR